MNMKKIVLAIFILGIVCTITACKKNTADSEENIGNTVTETATVETTATETSESDEAATFVPMKTVDTLQIDLEEDQEVEEAPN